MSKTKKTLSLVLSFVLVIALTIAGTVAYLTSKTSTVTNTFTVGKVAITLDEADTNTYGEPLDASGNVVDDVDDAKRDTANEYKLVPGHAYTKDPTVHFLADSEKSYLFVKVVDGLAAIEDDTTVAAQIAANGWDALEGVDNVYYKVVDAATEDTDYVVFETFKLKSDADVTSYASATIEITAYAIQFDGLASASAAWTAGGFGA